MSVCIAAIPDNHSEVWKSSSEKIPHMTLLFLHDALPEEAWPRVTEFIEHAAKFSLRKFGLDVAKRGTLGEDSADVLFFSDLMIQDIKTFRQHLLSQSDIQKAFNSTDQYSNWTPHLTLGYPDKPAKETEYPATYVTFDRIAIWFGDFDGPEFELRGYENMSEDLAMSEKIDNFLSHFGVKGMKWGVRRQNSGGSASKGSKSDDSNDTAMPSSKSIAVGVSRASGTSTDAFSNDELQALVTRMNLERQYRDLANTLSPKTGVKAFTKNLITEIAKSETSRVSKAAVSIAIENQLAKRGRSDIAKRIKPKKG